MIYQQNATVMWNQRINDNHLRIGLTLEEGYGAAVPGQFVMLQVGSGKDPLLRRPFSIFRLIGPRSRPEGIEILYRVVGRGTELMARLLQNQVVNVLGPLGRGFSVNADHRHIFLVAGGIGVAPIRFLADFLLERGLPPSTFHVFIGAQNLQDLLCPDEFANLGMTVTLTTDDGTAGDQCLVTDPLESTLHTRRPDIIYACGPVGMLVCLAGIAQKHRIPCQISIEAMMACGMGACLGCAVASSKAGSENRYLHVCVDGPVFESDSVQLQQLTSLSG
jgi:dihydroorotate dehydrogenase electron transfer subunit